MPLFEEEVVGFAALDKMAGECFGGTPADKIFFCGQSQKISQTEDGFLQLSSEEDKMASKECTDCPALI